MNPSLCLYFQVHHPFTLKNYRFFDIGKVHHYYDDFLLHNGLPRIAERSYLAANKILLEQLKKYDGNLKIAFSFSGIALEQFAEFAPNVLQSFQELVATGHVEIVGGTYAHSLASIKHNDEFIAQINLHKKLIKQYFGQVPTVFCNTELIYSDSIGEILYDLGFHAVLTEGARHVLGPKSPNFVYNHPGIPKFKVLLNNYQLTDNITCRFSDTHWSEYPLTTEKYISWLSAAGQGNDVINLYFNYQTFGELQPVQSGILAFLEHFPQALFTHSSFEVTSPSAVIKKNDPVGSLSILYAISCATEEKDLSLWMGNVLQSEALDKIYQVADQLLKSKDAALLKDWRYLQTIDHFFAMSTRGNAHGYLYGRTTPYESPYDAFINYMNVYSDFLLRIEGKIKVESQSNDVKSKGSKTKNMSKTSKSTTTKKIATK